MDAPAEKDIDRRQAERKPCHVRSVDFLDHGVGLQEIRARIDERKDGGNRGQQRDLALRLKRNQRRDGEYGEEQSGECQR